MNANHSSVAYNWVWELGVTPPPEIKSCILYIYIYTPPIMYLRRSCGGKTKYKILASEESDAVRPTVRASIIILY